MNQTHAVTPSRSFALSRARPDLGLEARFATRVGSALSERTLQLTPDVTERLRFARDQALVHARASRPAGRGLDGASVGHRTGAWLRSTWLQRLASFVPMVALIAGLVFIERSQRAVEISTAAEVDAALLTDDLPPGAYGDAGFAEYLKTSGE